MSKAVFLSYASQDAEAAKRICDALRQAGIEVWFDQSELVGGDAWDQKIRKQIKDCALLIPIISENTQSRTEGYFRLEWRLADQRTHLMAKGRPFLLPVVVDGTRDAEAQVPDSFTEVQWTKAVGGEVSPAFCARVKKLLTGADDVGWGRLTPPRDVAAGSGDPALQKKGPRWLKPVIGAAVVALIALAIFRPWEKAATPANTTKTVVAAPAGNTGSKPEVAVLLSRVRASLARIDTMRTELDTMEDLMAQAAKIDPTDASVWAEWAILDCRFMSEYYDRSPARKDAARQHAAQAGGLDPRRADVRFVQALVMHRLSDDAATNAEATKLLHPLLQDIPENGAVPIELGWLAFERGQSAEAQDWIDRAALVPGSAATAHFAKARLLLFTGRQEEVDPEFDRALAVERASKILLWKAYVLIAWNGDLVAARRVQNEVPPQFFVEDMPAITRYYLELLSRNYDRALAAVQAVSHDYLQSGAYSGPAGYFKGFVLELAGKTAAAELEWRSALATVERRLAAVPNDPDLMVYKALLQTALGDHQAGLRTWKATQELYPDYVNQNQLVQMRLQPESEAFAWAEGKVANGDPFTTAALLRLDPVFDPIRSDPRFPALLARAEADPRLSPDAKAKLAKAPKLDPSPASPLPVDSKSVAVLAFANLSDDKGNEYFSDGISEELLNVLAKVPGLKVTARTSSFHFKGKDTSIPEIAQQLGVAYVVEGSVRKAGDKVRITAQLIKAADGFHVWSDTFTRDLKDIFAVQDEIAALIAKNLELKMGMATAEVRQAVDPEAYQLYLQGRQALQRRNREGYAQAEKFFRQAETIAPKWAPVYAGLADVARLRSFGSGGGSPTGPGTPWPQGMKDAKTAAEQALALDPNLAEADVSLAGTSMLGWDFDEAERLLNRALELNPNLADAYLVLGRVHSAQGRMDEAIAAFQRASELNPLAPRILDNLAAQLDAAGRHREGWAVIERATALQPDSSQIQCYRARLLTHLGRRDEALRQAQQLIDDPREEERAFRLLEAAGALAAFGEREKAEAIAAKISRNLPEAVIVLGYLGRPADALPLLGQIDFGWIDDLLWGRGFDPIRHDPVYQEYLARTKQTAANARMMAWRTAHPVTKGAAK